MTYSIAAINDYGDAAYSAVTSYALSDKIYPCNLLKALYNDAEGGTTEVLRAAMREQLAKA